MPDTRWVALAFDLGHPPLRHRELLRGIQAYASHHPAWRCVLDPYPELGLPGRYQGVIARANSRLIDRAQETATPLVSIAWYAHVRRVPRVVPDYRAAGRLACAHLYGRGYVRFGYLGYARETPSRLQEQAFAAARGRRGLPCSTRLVWRNSALSPRIWKAHQDGMDRWLGSRELPLAVFACCDLLARYLADSCARLGLRVPADVAILGVGNDPVLCEQPEPALSSIDLDDERVGARAAALLDRLMDGRQPPLHALACAPRGVVARRSTDVALDYDPIVTRALGYIADHSAEAIRVSEVAAACAVPLRVLQRRFFGRPGGISGEIARARHIRARRLLGTTDLPVAEIARTCGYRTASRFARLFRRAEGLSPTAYRRREKAGRG